MFLQKWFDHLVLMTSYLLTMITDSHQTCVKMCLMDICTARVKYKDFKKNLTRPGWGGGGAFDIFMYTHG